MKRILEIREKAKKEKRKVVLPEGDDPRVVKGAAFAAREGIADVYLLGGQKDIEKLAGETGVSLEGVNIIDPVTHDKKQDIVNTFYEIRKNKGITPEQAEEHVMKDYVFYGAAMTRMGLVDGFVAGANHTTSNVARAAIQCLRLDREIGTVCSSFIMEMNDCTFGEEGLFAYGDCAVIPAPSQRQLVGIAIASSDIFRKLFGIEPRVAMLSYSTKGSAAATEESVLAIRNAVEKIKEKRPGLIIDGELQLDAAIVPEVAKRKCPDSEVAGRANVLIFPNLDAGNISYKLTQRLGKARAVGPVLQGLDKPCSDLSRGCSWEDVADVIAITAIRAQGAQ
ncbi:MAG: phosphate acetyltransferase [Candidatus Omnitrophota bacterium]|jgi:phosphate acetyltransferase